LLFEKIESQTVFYSAVKYIDFDKKDLDYFKSTFPSSVYCKLLFIASLNRSGYVREKAVKELLATQNPEAVRFIIFRLADWVEKVRAAARKAIEFYLQPAFIDEILKQLPLIEWLLTVERSNLTGIYNEIYQFIFGFEFNEFFYQKLNRLGDKIKFIYVRNYLNSNPVNGKIFEILSADKLFLVKIELLRHIEKLDDETQKRFIGKFLKDRSAKVRIYAIYSTKAFRAEFNDEILDLIFDDSAAVRELSRFVLRESGIDFAELYRRRLREDENSFGAILGLTEVGTEIDLPIFEDFVQKPFVKIKVACLTAINRLNKETAKNYALEFLSHSSAKVRNKSIEILASMVDDKVLEIARETYNRGNYEQKKTILKLFSKIGGWKTVGDFIIALGDKDERIQNLGWMNLERWRSNQLFIKPSPAELERVQRLYHEFDRSKLSADYERFWAELPFYLR
jgi:hypothetical protein